ncbi:MAG: 50S ribosomal protein L6 [Phycisphaerales bacterium]|nr:MAG: 50S ribosomal protein L6 [Phycisphaerales bacterium]
MSRLGNKPIDVPAGVKVQIAGGAVNVSGPKGSLSWTVPATAELALDEGGRQLRVASRGQDKQARANHGLTRSLVANMVRGVSEGYHKRLLIYGTGYNCKLLGNVLHLNIGYMGRSRDGGSQFEVPVPAGLQVDVETPAARGDNEPARLVIRGCDKQAVGQFAAEVRSLRKAEPYKGKGIRYENEVVRRKVGKALSGS